MGCRGGCGRSAGQAGRQVPRGAAQRYRDLSTCLPSCDCRGSPPSWATKVFLATDSTAVVEAAKKMVRVAVVTLQAVRDYWQMGRHGLNATEATAGALADVYLLSTCHAFIGTHVSAVSKAAYLLRYARFGGEGDHAVYWPRWDDDNPAKNMAYVYGTTLDRGQWSSQGTCLK
eukprot:Sspe_Gene.21678::Locus_8144_Transcript_1_2_Confidence_0.667_Length_1134::g.21678::m.21678